MKTWKKIEETKRRAGDVVRLKVKNEERFMKKQHFQMEEQHRQDYHKNQLQQIKNAREMEKQKIKDAIYLHKKEEAKQAKFIGEQHKNMWQKSIQQQK